TFKIEHGDLMQWRVMDVSMWVGHKAYIEIIDDGPGYAAVSKILAADDTAQPLPAPNYLILQMLDDIDLTSAEQLAERYQDLVQKTLQRWRQGELTRDDSDRLELLSQIVTNEALPLLPGQDVPPPDGLAELQEKQRELEKNLPAPRRALAMIDGTAWNERVYIRGNPKTLGDEVPRRLLEALGGLERPAPKQGSGRLELARQLVDPANPLTARVMVNRLWKHHFGEGLVRSVDNFGVLGEAPSHPELLDYLATQFVQKGWSIKQMHKLLVLSNTYQMASKPGDAKAEETDPQNKLLHRMPIRRLEAEAIRDSLLTISGRLDPKLYGPGVMPHLTPHMSGRGRPGVSGPLDGNGRRSIYINVRRNFLTPMFLAFDYPIPFTTIGKRTSSNVPAQALILMNNPLVAEQAQLWAKRSLAEGKLSPQERIEKLYVQAFARPPLEGELKEGLTFVQEQGKLYGNPDDLRLWTDFCHVLFNVKEFIFIN
ncbi:MAG: DUF1553 domain-containing protein, partial [Planctomycetia bacterium]|nr:DUF1553 domain-containing protein [Planctomycetia bacterium]